MPMRLTQDDVAYADAVIATVYGTNPADLGLLWHRGPTPIPAKIAKGPVRGRQRWVIRQMFRPRWREIWDRLFVVLMAELADGHPLWTPSDWVQWGQRVREDHHWSSPMIYWYLWHLPDRRMATDAATHWLVDQGDEWDREIRAALVRVQTEWPDPVTLVTDPDDVSGVGGDAASLEAELACLRQRVQDLEQQLADQAHWYETWWMQPPDRRSSEPRDGMAVPASNPPDGPRDRAASALAGMTWAVIGPPEERERVYQHWAQRVGVTLWFWPGHRLWRGGTLPRVDAIGVVTTSIKHGVWEQLDGLWPASIPRVYVPFNGIAAWDREVRGWMERQHLCMGRRTWEVSEQ
ncbi:hypothetical protein SAMN00768000_0207 [Sulfobacillus thermosulfidooxidans DSM 9293]|uniref:Uncharacterized protein n=1 Tax=Sulfobacillus thermosulfidooxidans (strain DSM 9293 / VKM B-1269 / AT-1) TaxID=929705 RepID=A0A1W1W6T8_SULTA|nr:hypothetical protein [Sulfobacillus thermosulfidooxidans]SMC01996.1 hypothetical protein SAMN00768000_0207 [Sulfobacillus thermosulfidooxidans DSM 9293]